jgi:hypothetical protein
MAVSTPATVMGAAGDGGVEGDGVDRGVMVVHHVDHAIAIDVPAVEEREGVGAGAVHASLHVRACGADGGVAGVVIGADAVEADAEGVGARDRGGDDRHAVGSPDDALELKAPLVDRLALRARAVVRRDGADAELSIGRDSGDFGGVGAGGEGEERGELVLPDDGPGRLGAAVVRAIERAADDLARRVHGGGPAGADTHVAQEVRVALAVFFGVPGERDGARLSDDADADALDGIATAAALGEGVGLDAFGELHVGRGVFENRVALDIPQAQVGVAVGALAVDHRDAACRGVGAALVVVLGGSVDVGEGLSVGARCREDEKQAGDGQKLPGGGAIGVGRVGQSVHGNLLFVVPGRNAAAW